MASISRPRDLAGLVALPLAIQLLASIGEWLATTQWPRGRGQCPLKGRRALPLVIQLLASTGEWLGTTQWPQSRG